MCLLDSRNEPLFVYKAEGEVAIDELKIGRQLAIIIAYRQPKEIVDAQFNFGGNVITRASPEEERYQFTVIVLSEADLSSQRPPPNVVRLKRERVKEFIPCIKD